MSETSRTFSTFLALLTGFVWLIGLAVFLAGAAVVVIVFFAVLTIVIGALEAVTMLLDVRNAANRAWRWLWRYRR